MNILGIRKTSTGVLLGAIILSALLLLGFSHSVIAGEDRELSVEISALGYIEGEPFEVPMGSEVTYIYEITNVGERDVWVVGFIEHTCGTNDIIGVNLVSGESVYRTCTQIIDQQNVTNTVTINGYIEDTSISFYPTDTFYITVRGTSCTLGQGYWKTHSPLLEGTKQAKKIDPIWAGYAASEWNGIKWYEVFNTSPKDGGMWYQLAHQYMTARLNGAHLYEAGVMTQAYNWLSTNESNFVGDGVSYDYVGGVAPDPSWLGALASFNRGDTGPGHCSKTNK